MKINPKSKSELDDLDSSRCLPKGQYLATIQSAVEKVSKKGNEMIELQLLVPNPEEPQEQPRLVYDYVSDAWMPGKIKNLMYAAGLEAQYERGNLDPVALREVEVKVDLRIEVDTTGQYGAKNKVADYIPAPSSKEWPPKGTDSDSDLPFD